MGYTPPQLEVRKITGGWSALAPTGDVTDDLYLFPNTVSTYASIALLGNGGVYLRPYAGSSIRFYDGATIALESQYDTANSQYIIESKIDAKDLYLKTTGTGVVKFGTYTAGAATDSTGYITIKDAAGNTRKLMVQA